MFLQERHILSEQLFLQGFRRCRDDYAPPAANGRDQVGEGFARAGARLDDRVLMLLKSLIHNFRHGQLRGTKFVSGVAAFQQSARPKDSLDRYFLGFCRSSSFFRHWMRWRNREWLCALNLRILHASEAARCRNELHGNHRIYRIWWRGPRTMRLGERTADALA